MKKFEKGSAVIHYGFSQLLIKRGLRGEREKRTLSDEKHGDFHYCDINAHVKLQQYVMGGQELVGYWD